MLSNSAPRSTASVPAVRVWKADQAGVPAPARGFCPTQLCLNAGPRHSTRRRVRRVDIDLNVPAGRIRARRWGSEGAPLLLCVHGLSANLSAFTYIAEHLASQDRQVVAIDLRGRGRSELTAPGSYGLENHARDVIDVATALGADEFDLAGWSLGALISMRVALRHGTRLRSVTLIDHTGPTAAAALAPLRAGLARLHAVAPTPDAYLQAIRAAGAIDPWSPFWDAYYTYELEQLPDGSWSPSTSRAAAEEDLDQEWPSHWGDHWRALTMPAVLVRAMEPVGDALLVPDDAVDALLAANPAIRIVETPESNHFTCIIDPMTLAAIERILIAPDDGP
jgi:pimeloyl-ACP methyl ester carboxylesterase